MKKAFVTIFLEGHQLPRSQQVIGNILNRLPANSKKLITYKDRDFFDPIFSI